MAEAPIKITITLPSETVKKMENMAKLPDELSKAVVRGMDSGVQQLVKRIQQRRLTGTGPFPVSDHRLGVRSGVLIGSVAATPAAIRGDTVSASITASATHKDFPYALAHEYGATVTARNAPFLVFKIGDRLIRTKSVIIPQRAPFRTEIQSPESAKLVSAEIGAEIEKAWAKL